MTNIDLARIQFACNLTVHGTASRAYSPRAMTVVFRRRVNRREFLPSSPARGGP
jgi:hypothetical protein